VVEKRSATQTLVLTDTQDDMVSAIESSNSAFTTGATTPPMPASLAPGATLSVPVTFTPTTAEEYVGAVSVTTDVGPFAASLTGYGEASTPKLRVDPGAVRFGGIAIGSSSAANVVLTNEGVGPLTFTTITAPAAPFVLLGAPAPGQTLASGASLIVGVTFAPPVGGTFASTLTISTSANSVGVYLSGTAAIPASLSLMPTDLDYGTVAVGSSTPLSFLLTNGGGVPLTITKAKPPSEGTFIATTSLPEGTDRPPMSTITETVLFQPKSTGAFEDTWVIGSSAGSGTKTVTLHGLAGDGKGLSATYFDGSTLSSATTVQRIDPTVDFDWQSNAPAPGISVPAFSVRWTGSVEPVYSENYTFETISDQGVRLWVNGVALIDDWTSHPKTTDMGTIALVAGQKYDIVIEYYNQTGTADMTLKWSSPSTPLEVIPSVFLFP
jgi:hypothetical protein